MCVHKCLNNIQHSIFCRKGQKKQDVFPIEEAEIRESCELEV